MKKRNFARDTIIVGLALFATMFGAGNLIFPPQIGLFSGTQWVLGALGLLFGGIILPVLALWAVNNVGEDAKDLMRHVSPWCYNLYYLIGCSLIAMGSTLPRSAATTHEMAIQPLFPNVPIWITVVVFFALVYFFACDPNSVIDKLGKYMTPILVVLLAIVLIKGVISPVGQPIDTGIGNPFGTAILTAYNTGDLTVGILFASVILLDLRRRGYDGKACKRGGFLAGIVCIVVLFAVYGTLTYIGACASATYPQDTAQTALLSGIIREIMGTAGMACLGCAVALACLTTAVGIGTTAVGFFYEFFKQKVPYKVLMLIACLIGVFMGITGVQNIVNYVTPLFLVIYPSTIVMTVLGLLNNFLPNDGPYKGGVLMAAVVSLGDAVLSVNPNIGWLQDLMSWFPLSGMGFSWLVPAIIGAVVGTMICRGRPKYQPLAATEETAQS
ncbi:branched-chain amino acid transport system II carrier protein [Intestinimonas massiliensis (ex Afouda et al. 2020)]|uniref:branched-chain amino acid transport system II carrier protein n=1 Tax=Intestinimonas massiliensis (ex Afouda et al. 2020) TaxID=1673721 RepID=UPI001030BADA|nr:branched-chain amino acid transport system II carrier protein [Intestinimonas massiliensis (ex Afouda et al. 2020)]